MSARYEWLCARGLPIGVIVKDEPAPDGQKLELADSIGLVIGDDNGVVIWGYTSDELVEFAGRILDKLPPYAPLSPEEQRLLEEAEAEAYGPIE